MLFLVYYLVQHAKMPKLRAVYVPNLIDRTTKIKGSQNYRFYSNSAIFKAKRKPPCRGSRRYQQLSYTVYTSRNISERRKLHTVKK